MKQLRISALIFNFFIALLCIAAIGGYFSMPLLDFKISATITDASSLIDSIGASGSEDISSIDFDETLNGLEVNLSVSLNAIDVINSIPEALERDTEITELPQTIVSIIDSNVSQLVSNVSQQLDNIITTVMPAIISDLVTEELYTAVNEGLKETLPEITDEETRTMLSDVGIDDEYISTVVTNTFDAMFSENATVTSVTEYVIDTAKDICNRLQQSKNETLSSIEFTPEAEASIQESIENLLYESGIANEDGSLKLNDFGLELILSFIKGEEDSTPAALTSTTDTNESNPTTQEELETELKNYIYAQIPTDAQMISYVMIVLYVLAGIVLFSMLSWLYVLIKIIVKSFSKNPAVKLKAPILLGWFPFILLMAIPNIALMLIPLLIPAAGMPFTYQAYIMSSSVIAFFAAIALIIISFSYGALRKKIKVESIVKHEINTFNA